MSEDKLIDPAWLVKARVDRRKFAMRVAVVFLILSILAWWALPRLETQHQVFSHALAQKKAPKTTAAPGVVSMLAGMAGVFKGFWVAIAIGCGAAVALAFTGKIDSLIPVLNIAVLLLGAGGVALTFYVFYAPTLIALEGLK